MLSRLLAGALALVYGLAVAVPAFAGDAAGAVVIPLGDLVAAFASAVGPAALALLAWIVNRWVPAIIRPLLTEQLLTRALDYALAATEGAAKGKVLTVPVANEVLRQAGQYAVDHGAPWLLKWIGDTVEPKLIARLSAAGALPEEAHLANLTARE